jgi:hypothetical protein
MNWMWKLPDPFRSLYRALDPGECSPWGKITPKIIHIFAGISVLIAVGFIAGNAWRHNAPQYALMYHLGKEKDEVNRSRDSLFSTQLIWNQ